VASLETLFIMHGLCKAVVGRSVKDALERPKNGTFVPDLKLHLFVFAETEESLDNLESIRYMIPDSKTGLPNTSINSLDSTVRRVPVENALISVLNSFDILLVSCPKWFSSFSEILYSYNIYRGD